MINEQNLNSLSGANVVDSDGHKIGSVGQIYVDSDSGRPSWATVKTGLFGTSESFVPLEQAEETGGDLRVPFSKDFVKDAPRIESDGELSEAEEDELYAYYRDSSRSGGTGGTGDDFAGNGTGVGTGTTGVGTGTTGGTFVDDVDRDRDTGRGVGGDDAMTRSEERLNVGTERVETGRARLRKYVVTDHETVTVPVEREEVRLEREPITDGNAGDALDGPDISEAEHEVVLTEERPVVDKETVPVERVRLDTETVSDTERVEADVRKEEVELDGDADGRRGV
ncbi:PRC and DUF2382 domain-containing protein [Microbacterium oryzae]|uniref:PRC and DUF2382 domain-containing protein n=1 Tax=Microbacterium oryzae TaxID=743009 RepID=UPI0025B23DD0|nr:PRC and DUF2382 domain-containing protein [Microbacterium oryzae]MDN3311968.1 PRC and DUF2382 domain-containing protein [Microbacterium oryzae]